MNRILIVEPENYEDLAGELDEVGINYDLATEEEAPELFTRIDYDAVVGPSDDGMYVRTVSDDTPFLVYDDFDDVSSATDRLSGDSEFDARRVAAYTGAEGFESYTEDLTTIVEGHDDMDLFLDMLEHDVKNDVHVAQTYFGLMDIDSADKERQETIDERLRSINRLMETIGIVRKLEDPGDEQVNVTSLFDQMESCYESMASEEGFDLEFDYDEDIVVSAGPLLDDMYGQLIENSIRHSNGSHIRVTAENSDNPRVVVEDDGEGIPEEIQDNLFQEGIMGRKTGNTGIGTTLVDRIANRYDISVEVGESDMGGAEFRLEHQPAENC